MTLLTLIFCISFFTSLEGVELVTCLEQINEKVLKELRFAWPTKVPEGPYVINGKKYIAEQKLGQGSSLVYLGRGEDGIPVSIKVMFCKGGGACAHIDWAMYSFPYEYYATKYFETFNFPVAKVYGYKVSKESAYLVREYKHGLTFDEMMYSSNFSGTVKDQLRSDLYETMADFEAKQDGLKNWIVKNYDDVTMEELNQQTIFANDLYIMGDYKEDNFIYSLDEKRWVLIDP